MSEHVRQWTSDYGDVVTIFEDAGGEYRWHVKATNGEIVGHGESHPDLADAVQAARRHHPPVPSDT